MQGDCTIKIGFNPYSKIFDVYTPTFLRKYLLYLEFDLGLMKSYFMIDGSKFHLTQKINTLHTLLFLVTV